MSLSTSILLLIILLVYIVFFIVYMRYYISHRTEDIFIEENKKILKTFFYEEKIIKSLHLNPLKIKGFIIFERIIVSILILSILIVLRGLGMALVGSIFITLFAEDAYQKIIYDSGITNIVKINNFINFFAPHINSGNSADQSLLAYIAYSEDEDLKNFYENKDKGEKIELNKHTRQIVDIYDIAKYNESKGISDYTGILNEIAKDYEQKQKYYNKFISGMGEIKPTELSYYFGVPILIIISFSQTKTFWMSGGGIILSLALLILFALFKFLIYRLQKSTIMNIF